MKKKLLAMCTLIVLTSLFALGVTLLALAWHYNEESMNGSLDSVADGYASAVGQWVSDNAAMVSAVGEDMSGFSPMSSLQQLVRAGKYSSAFVGYVDKRAMFTDDAVPAGYDPTVRPWFRLAANAGQPVVTQPYLDATTGKSVVSFAVPFQQQGKLAGVVAASVSSQHVSEVVAAIHPTPASYGFLVSSEGIVLAYPDAVRVLKPIGDVSDQLSADRLMALAQSREIGRVSLGGAEKRIRVERIAGANWLLVVALDNNDARGGFRLMLRWSIVILVAAGLLAVLIAWVLVSRAFRNLEMIEHAMGAVSAGDADLSRRLPVHGSDEIARVATSFNRFVEKLKATMLDVGQVAASVETATAEIAAGQLDLSSRTEQTAVSLEATATSVNELSTSVAQTSEVIATTSGLTGSVATLVESGNEAVSKAMRVMSNIEAASGKIQSIIGLIDGIAFQTNILALNAAVESARAGENGKR